MPFTTENARIHGAKGGTVTVARHGRAHMARLGLITKARHGIEHYRMIGRAGFATTVRRHWDGDIRRMTQRNGRLSVQRQDRYAAFNAAFSFPQEANDPW